MKYLIADADGHALDATVEITDQTLILHSRGGTTGTPAARNRDYAKALRLMLKRILSAKLDLEGAWVDSSRVQHLPLAEREVLTRDDLPADAGELFTRMGQRMKQVGRPPTDAPAQGNANKRIRFSFRNVSGANLVHHLGAIPADGGKGHRRELCHVTPDHVWLAISALSGNELDISAGFQGERLVTDDGLPLPATEVLEKAMSLATGDVEVSFLHGALGGEERAVLERAGYTLLNASEEAPTDAEKDDRSLLWLEGSVRLVTHQRRERGRGLAKAKKAAFVKEHGRLFCERCGFDPVEVFGDPDGEAAIEVHHHVTAVAHMDEEHVTSLDDVQCLCANCHRYVHRKFDQSL